MTHQALDLIAILGFFSRMEAARRERMRKAPGSADFIFDPAEDGAVLRRYLGNAAEVEIPDTYGGRPVIAVGPYAFARCERLRRVTIPGGVKTLGEGAFGGCGALEEISLSDSVTSLGLHCFAECTALRRLRLPAALGEIPDGLCRGCTSLEKITWPVEGLRTIGWQAFGDCAALTDLIVPDGAREIGEMAFCRCSALAELQLPRTLRHIDDGAFAFCRNLTQAVLPEGLQRLGTKAFFGCDRLQRVEIPSTLTDVEENPFGACPVLEGITVAPGNPVLRMAGGMLLDGVRGVMLCCPPAQGLAFAILPEGTQEVGSYAFSHCRELRHVTLPPSVETLGRDAFAGCTGLKAIVKPEKKREI